MYIQNVHVEHIILFSWLLLILCLFIFPDIVGPPVAGYFADKLGNFRFFMSAVTFLNGAASLFLLTLKTVPTGDQGLILRSSILAENFSPNFLPQTLD
jgi:MFS family permease